MEARLKVRVSDAVNIFHVCFCFLTRVSSCQSEVVHLYFRLFFLLFSHIVSYYKTCCLCRVTCCRPHAQLISYYFQTWCVGPVCYTGVYRHAKAALSCSEPWDPPLCVGTSVKARRTSWQSAFSLTGAELQLLSDRKLHSKAATQLLDMLHTHRREPQPGLRRLLPELHSRVAFVKDTSLPDGSRSVAASNQHPAAVSTAVSSGRLEDDVTGRHSPKSEVSVSVLGGLESFLCVQFCSEPFS